jgi:hypothetical protein
MEAVPLSTISVADCTLALVFHWINCSGIPHMITLDRGPQFISNLLAELNILHGQTTAHHPEATVWLKDCIAASRIRSVPVPLRILGPRRSLGSSSHFVCSRGKTVVFPRLKPFLAPPLVLLPNEFLQADEFSVDQIFKKFTVIPDTPALSLPSKHNSGSQLL